MSVKPKALIPVVIMAVAMVCGCVDQGRVAVDSEDPFYGTTLDSKDILATIDLMAREIVKLPQIANAEKPPVFAFAKVVNRSGETIDGELFLEQIREKLMQHSGGKIAFLDRALAAEVMRERDLKRRGEVTSSSKKAVLGADLFLAGTIRSRDKTDGKIRSTYTVVQFKLTDTESTLLIWSKSYQVKKIGKPGVWDR